jgi:hypothetical protein
MEALQGDLHGHPTAMLRFVEITLFGPGSCAALACWSKSR